MIEVLDVVTGSFCVLHIRSSVRVCVCVLCVHVHVLG